MLGLGVAVGIGATGTLAAWTDEVTVAGTTFTAGRINLQVNGADTVTGYTTLNISGLVPGSSTAGVLTISNSGTSPLKYTAATTASNADGLNLRASLVVKVSAATSVTGTSPAATCAGTALANTASTFNGPLLSVGRTLAGGGAESFCVQVTLDPAAPTSLQGTAPASPATTTVGFTFSGTSDLS